MQPVVRLIHTLLLPDFPSGSSINYKDGRFYIAGDDAGQILILGDGYQRLNTVRISDHPEKRIPKKEKADLEAATLMELEGRPYLLVLGSAATEKRETSLLMELNTTHTLRVFSTAVFTSRLKQQNIPEINIEGATLLEPYLLLANRGNNTWPHNHLIITGKDYFRRQDNVMLHTATLHIPPQPAGFAGVSALCYIAGKDLLLLTLSSEATANAYDDGAIGNSYIAWITNITSKIHQPELTVEGIIDLPAADKAFKGEKIEGICLEKTDNNLLHLHLVSDNDLGASRLFHITMRFPDTAHQQTPTQSP